ncbi:SprT family protein [Streptococcus sp. zg-JUN1979]|uniref:SprT family protein n=1 Tax=Streptococcus sp. zg-JUN1979 TaxID=3391450 RepID=UPI0039A6AECB
MNLTNYVKKVSLEDFGRPFCHQAQWNNRLRSTGGRFFPADGHLDFNPKLYAAYGLAVFRKIVKHELCHYHLYYAHKGYKHGDKDFKDLLKQVDGLRYAPKLDTKTRLYTYQCQSCHMMYRRKRRVNTKTRVCGVCHGPLVFKNQS